MGGRYRPVPSDSVDPIVDAITGLEDRARASETPTGTALSNLVAQVKAAIVGISAQVSAAVAALPSITVPGLVRSSGGGVQAATTVVAGTTVSAGTGISTAGGDITTPAALRSGDIYATNAPGFNITGSRVAAYWETATGRGGYAPSSRTLKTHIEHVDLDRMRAILAVGVYHYSYIAEVRKRDDPGYEFYVGPDYHVGINIGVMAEELHAAGLWEFVVYERRRVVETVVETDVDEDGLEILVEHEVVVGEELVLDENGEPKPIAVHDNIVAYAVIPVVQDHDRRLAAIEKHLGLGE